MAIGRVDRPNAFGSESIGSNSNLNNYTDPGIYDVTSSTVAGTITNSPYTGGGYTLLVLPKGGYQTQLIFTGSNIYSRTRTSSGWGSWRVASMSAV